MSSCFAQNFQLFGDCDMYEKIKDMCSKKGITITVLERELGFAKGSLSKIDRHKPSVERLQRIADFFGVSVDYFSVQHSDHSGNYYFDNETAKLAQELFDNKELRALFDVSRGMSAEDLKAMYGVALALKRKERGTDDSGN
jgi:transcriptional regulator with XRE-family HTH domain